MEICGVLLKFWLLKIRLDGFAYICVYVSVCVCACMCACESNVILEFSLYVLEELCVHHCIQFLGFLFLFYILYTFSLIDCITSSEWVVLRHPHLKVTQETFNTYWYCLPAPGESYLVGKSQVLVCFKNTSGNFNLWLGFRTVVTFSSVLSVK